MVVVYDTPFILSFHNYYIKTFKSGIPQGSVLAALLLNLYINDLPDTVISKFQYAHYWQDHQWKSPSNDKTVIVELYRRYCKDKQVILWNKLYGIQHGRCWRGNKKRIVWSKTTIKIKATAEAKVNWKMTTLYSGTYSLCGYPMLLNVCFAR